MVIVAPGHPLEGEKEVIVGAAVTGGVQVYRRPLPGQVFCPLAIVVVVDVEAVCDEVLVITL